MTDQTITSEWFSLPRRVYERYVAMRWLERKWWIIVVPLLAAVGASAALGDVRWVLVALMYMFIVGPGIVSIAYFRYLLTPEARLTALTKRLAITPGRDIVITYRHQAPEDGDEGVAEESEDGSPDYDWLPADEIIPWSEVVRIVPNGGNYVIELRPHPWPRFLIVPRKALSRPLDWQ